MIIVNSKVQTVFLLLDVYLRMNSLKDVSMVLIVLRLERELLKNSWIGTYVSIQRINDIEQNNLQNYTTFLM